MTVRRGYRAATPGFLVVDAGGIMVPWIMSTVAVLAFVALVLDVGRMQVTHGQSQSVADSVALGAAGELDGRSGAITRATDAANLVSDSTAAGDDGVLSGSTDDTLTSLTVPPADGTTGAGGSSGGILRDVVQLYR